MAMYFKMQQGETLRCGGEKETTVKSYLTILCLSVCYSFHKPRGIFDKPNYIDQNIPSYTAFYTHEIAFSFVLQEL